MLDAITSAQIGLLQDQLNLQTLAHNVSNVQTPGYKRQILNQIGFDTEVISNPQSPGPQMQIMHQLQQGTVLHSNSSSELAIKGEGFFVLQTEKGTIYSRRGDFHLNESGELVAVNNAKLLGKNGPIQVEQNNFRINARGELFVNNQYQDQLQLVEFSHPEKLNYQGQSAFTTEESPQVAGEQTQVLQAKLEQSNVKSVEEMMDMVKISRHFEAVQQIMKTADNMLGAAINQLGESNV